MRKSTLIALMLSAAAFGAAAQTPDCNQFGARFHSPAQPVATGLVKAPAKITAEEVLGCPEGTVFAGPYSDDGGYSGFQSSDQGRTDLTTKFYQHFSNCYYTFNGVRFYGFFNYWDAESYNWMFCDERAGIDENDKMTKPVRFEITFTKEAANGEPGEVVYTKEFDLTGVSTGAQYGDMQSGYQSIFAFDVDLGEELKLETGYLSVSAVKTETPVDCWFSLFTSSSSVDYAMIEWDGDGYQFATLPMIFCLKGSGEMASDKALKLNRLMSPSASGFGKYERVQVELLNAGKGTISDAELELWADGTRLCTEKVDGTLISGATHKYQFATRIDCSTPGAHKFEIRNVTPGDEGLCSSTYAFTIDKPAGGTVGHSESETCEYNYIENVSAGEINNTTEATTYSDFTDQKATIHPGETLTLTVTPTSQYAYTTVFVDWNNNGILGEAGETYELDYYNKFTASLTIPEGTYLEEGDRLIRVITSYDQISPTGTYGYGETEDYTLEIARNANTPAIACDVLSIDESVKENATTASLTLSNTGDSELTGTLTYTYLLPNYPSSRFSTAEPVGDIKLNAHSSRLKAAQRAAAPAADNTTRYTLRYDNGQYDAIGITNSDASIYANLYPGNMLTYLKGMTISSVDVYIGEVPGKTSVVIYGQNTQTRCGDLICEQAFTATEYSWNHIVLDKPVTIGDTDLWIGVNMSEFNKTQYHIGIDYGTAVRGFGDIINIGGNTWWSMADLGLDYNYCIRANVTGEPTDAISWLTTDGSSVDIAPGQSSKFNFTLDPSKLDSHPVYEALVEVSSNDELCPKLAVPVYMTQTGKAALSAPSVTSGFNIALAGTTLTVTSSQTVKSIAVTSVSGQTSALAEGSSVNLRDAAHGIYIVTVNFADGKSANAKIALR